LRNFFHRSKTSWEGKKPVTEPRRRQKVQSAETGADILKALARLGPSVPLSRLADHVGMPAAKAHRYLQSLIASGLAAQDPATGRYRLGPEMLSIGLAALGTIDVVELAAPHLTELRDATGHSCFLAVWANHGPTVVSVRQAVGAVTLVTRVGSVLPLLGSATGLVFATFLDTVDTEGAIAAELKDLRAQLEAPGAPLALRLAAIRERRISAVHGLLLPGIDALAVPVLGPDGLAAVLTSLGPHNGFDVSLDGPIARGLAATAATIGAGLGTAYGRRFG
jgi:DNA-binding IclR family transcriptional regulator